MVNPLVSYLLWDYDENISELLPFLLQDHYTVLVISQDGLLELNIKLFAVKFRVIHDKLNRNTLAVKARVCEQGSSHTICLQFSFSIITAISPKYSAHTITSLSTLTTGCIVTSATVIVPLVGDYSH